MNFSISPPPISRAVCLAASIAVALFQGETASAQTISNPGFETDTFTVFPGYVSNNGPITGWYGDPVSKIGINPAGTSPFANNGTIPEGSQVAFIQNNGAAGTFLETDITGLTAGVAYKVNFRINARNGNLPDLRVWTHTVGDATRTPTSDPVAMTISPVGGTADYRYAAYEFTATDVQQTLTLNNFSPAGDHTVLVDDFSIAVSSGAWSYAAWTGDADSGIDRQYPYTHAYTFGNTAIAATVNQVDFTALPGANPSDPGNLTVSGLPNVFNDVPRTLSGGSNAVGKSFIFNGNGGIQIDNLLPNTEYVASIYGVAFDVQPVTRTATFYSDLNPSDRLTVDLDHYDQTNGIVVNFTYTTDALGSPVTIYYDAIKNGTTYHTSAFSNRTTTPGSIWTTAAWSDDATSGVYSAYTYTHAYNFGSAANPTINGVPFTGIAGVNPSAGNFTSSGLDSATGDASINIVDLGSIALASRFFYNGNPAVINMTGLTPGQDYVMTIYSVAWEDGVRSAFFREVGETTAALLNQGEFGNNNGIRIEHTYTAPPSGNYSISSSPTGGTIHHYGFSNREVHDGSPIITQQPADSIVGLGDSVTLTVAAIGDPTFTYVWKKGGVVIPGETAASFTIVSAASSDGGDYTAEVTNGVATTASDIATISVLDVIPGLFDTGIGSNCVAQPGGAEDPHYLLINNPDGTPLIPAVVETNIPGAWLANTVTSKWVGPTADTIASQGELVDGGAGAGVYVYRATVDLTGFDPATVIIMGGWASDNAGLDIYVNGVATGETNIAGFAVLTPFTLSSANATFVAGLNNIDFHVQNATVALGFTGLRVSGLSGFGNIPPGTAPHIAVQPVDTVVAHNTAACLAVGASGSVTLTYQWFKDSDPISGATDSTFTTAVATDDSIAGLYKVEVTNGSGSVTSTEVTVTVPNTDPVAGDDALETIKDNAATIDVADLLLNDTDADLDTLTFTGVSAASVEGGTVSESAGVVTYTPFSGFTGSDSFTYTIDDGWGGVVDGTVNVTVRTIYGSWAQSNGLTEGVDDGDGDDPETDNLVNLLEFGFGTDPSASDNNPLAVTDGSSFTPGTPVVSIVTPFSPATVTARFVRRKDAAAAGLTYVPEFSADLSIWETDSEDPTPNVVSTQAGDYEVVEVPYLVFLSDSRKAKFFRIRLNSTESGSVSP